MTFAWAMHQGSILTTRTVVSYHRLPGGIVFSGADLSSSGVAKIHGPTSQ
jgi:hypothetical protein